MSPCRLPRVLSLLSALLAVVPLGSAAGEPLEYFLPAKVAYNPKVPTPEQFFGFQIGEWHLSSHQVVSYLQAVAAAAPDRVKFEIIGYTHEHKPLVVLTISAPENLSSLEKIRADHLALFDPAKSGNLDLAQMPVVGGIL